MRRLPWAVATLLLCRVTTIDSDAVYAGDLDGRESSSTLRRPLLKNQDRVIYYNEVKGEYVRWSRDDCGNCEGYFEPEAPRPELTDGDSWEPVDPTPPKVLKSDTTKPAKTTEELTSMPAPTDFEEPTPAPTNPGDSYPEPTPAVTTIGNATSSTRTNPDTTVPSSSTRTGASASTGTDNDTTTTTGAGATTSNDTISTTGTGTTTSNATIPDTTTTSTGDAGSAGLSAGGIAGIAVACAVVVAVVIGAVLYHQRSIARQREENTFAELSDTAVEIDYAAM